MRNESKFGRSALLIAASVLVLGSGFASADADDLFTAEQSISIENSSLSAAIVELSYETDVPIFAASSLTTGRSVEPFTGEYSVQTALDLMLQDTDLVANANSAGGFILAQLEAPEPAAPTTAQVDDDSEPVTVQDLPVDTQDTQEDGETDDASFQMNVVRVMGFRGALFDALEKKRNANQIIDSISAEEVGKFSDFNVTDALARISGAQISRQSGEGETVNLRGLSSGFARVELDGRKVSATRDNNTPERGTVLTQFSTELFDNVEVIKTPKASDVEGGIGGIVRLNTPDPLTIGELAYGFEVGASVSDKYDFTQTNLNGFASNVFMDGKLGVLGSFVIRHDDNALSRTTGRDEPLTVAQLVDDDDFVEFPELAPFADVFVMQDIAYEDIAGDEENYNVNLKLQYQLTPDIELYAGGAYSFEERTLNRGNLGLNPVNGDLVPLSQVNTDASEPIIVNSEGAATQAAWTNGRLTAQSEFNNLENTLLNYNFGFNMDVTDRLRARFDAAWSTSEEIRDLVRVTGRTDGIDAYYGIEDGGEFPVVTVIDYEAAVANLINSRFDELRKFDREIREDDAAARIDLEYDVYMPAITSIEAGVRFSRIETDRLRVRVRNQRRNNDFLWADQVEAAAIDNPVEDFFGGDLPSGAITDWPSLNAFAVWDLAEQFAIDNDDARGLAALGCVADYFNLDCASTSDVSWEPPRSTEEETWAYYGMANYDWGNDNFNIRGNFGVRVVTTKTTGEGAIETEQEFFVTDGNGNLVDGSGTLVDTDNALPVLETENVTLAASPLEGETTNVLPSWNFAISRDSTSDFIIRGGIARTETRPNYGDIVPNLSVNSRSIDGVAITEPVTVNTTDGTVVINPGSLSSGNPELEPFLAWNYDIGFEWYFGEQDEGLFTASYFYKDIEDIFFDDVNIQSRTVVVNGDEFGIDQSSQPFNGGDAVVSGLEFGFQTPFTFLPGFWSDFGVFGNYTYLIDAELTPVQFLRDDDTGEFVLDENGRQILEELPTQPFFDASEHTYNIAGYYEKGGLSARLAYNYRDEHRRGSTEYIDDFGRLDLALRYRFDNGLRLSFDALNITEDERVTFHSPDDASAPVLSQPTLRDYEPVIYQFGVAYTF